MKKISLLMAVLLVLSLVNMDAFAANDTAKTDTLAKISELKGDASIVKEATQKTIKAFKNMKLSEGDKVITTKDAQLRMFLENKILVIVEGSSEVIIRKNSKNKETQGYERLLELKTGSLVVVTDKKLQNQEKLEVKTQTMVAGVRGTSFGIVSKPDHYYIEVYEGVVSLKPNKEYYKDNPAISNLEPILITKQRTKLIKYNELVKDYNAKPKKTQEPLIYPNVLLRFREDVDYYGKYKSDLKEKQAQENLKPDMKQAMESRLVDVMGNKFTFEKAYGFKKVEEKVIAGGGGGGGGSHRVPVPENVDYSKQPIPNGTYKETVNVGGAMHTVEVSVKNGKIKNISIPTLAPMPNDVGLVMSEIKRNNAIDKSEPLVSSPTVKPFVEALENALKKEPEPTLPLTGLNNGVDWYGQGRGNERYDLSSAVGPMEVKMSVAGGRITNISHENFGDSMSLKPANTSSPTDGNTYGPIRNAVVTKGSTDFVKKAVLRGENASGLSEPDKTTARLIYEDVINGATNPEQIKKRQKSAIGYINAIDNAIERSKAGHIVVNVPGGSHNLRKLYILANFFEQQGNKVFYKKPKDLSNINFEVGFTDGTTALLTPQQLQNTGIVIGTDDSATYASTTKMLTYTKNLPDYSLTSKFELSFSHPRGFEQEVQVPVTRGIDEVNLIATKELLIGKGGENFKLPFVKNSDNHVIQNYLISGRPKFMRESSFDVLKAIGEGNKIFDFTQEYNIDTGRVQLALVPDVAMQNLTFDLNKNPYNFRILNTPSPSEHEYKLSDMASIAQFDVKLYAEYERVELSETPYFKMTMERGEKILDSEWASTAPPGTPGGYLPINIVGTNGNIESNLQIRSGSDLVKWGFYTKKYFDEAVPADHPLGTETIRLWLKTWDEHGNFVEHDTGIDLEIQIV